MTKTVAPLALLILCVACGGGSAPPAADATGPEAASVSASAYTSKRERPARTGDIHVPAGYGWEADSHARCDGSYDGAKCYVPHGKKIRYEVSAGNCSGRDWAGIIESAVLRWADFNETEGTGFQFAAGDAGPEETRVMISCEAGWMDLDGDAEGPAGGTMPEAVTCTGPANHQLCRMQSVRIIIGGNNAMGACTRAALSFAQCKLAIGTLVAHHLGHAQGLGDAPGGDGEPALMEPHAYNGFITWRVMPMPTGDEAAAMCGYNPDGATPGC